MLNTFFFSLIIWDLFSLVGWSCGDRATNTSLRAPPSLSCFGIELCDSQDYRHNKLVTAGGNNPDLNQRQQQEKKT
jgi:hypothetical protein